LIIRRLIVPLTVGVITIHAGHSFAQGAFPAPLPGQAAPSNASPFPPVNGAASPFPPVNGAPAAPRSSFPVTGAAPVTGTGFERGPTQAAGPQDDCMKGFLSLREDTEKRGKLIKAASERHAPPAEACKLITAYTQSELKMIAYIDSHAAKCGIPPQIGEQLRTGHKGAEAMAQKVCAVAQQQPKGASGPSLSEVLGSSAVLPDATSAKRSGGSTFDTLNGNVLAR
jgi:hypothetical protein